MVGLPQDWAVGGKGHDASSQATQTLVEDVLTQLLKTKSKEIPDPDS